MTFFIYCSYKKKASVVKRKILNELERLAFKSGITTLSFETAKSRPLALDFYRKHGYKQTSRGSYGGVETVHFRKVIDTEQHSASQPSPIPRTL